MQDAVRYPGRGTPDVPGPDEGRHQPEPPPMPVVDGADCTTGCSCGQWASAARAARAAVAHGIAAAFAALVAVRRITPKRPLMDTSNSARGKEELVGLAALRCAIAGVPGSTGQ